MTLYAATTNPGKLAEFATSASSAGIHVLALPGLASMPEPLEDAPTFLGNAEKKAIAYSLLAPGLLVFADDSGLSVDALHGQPGVRSARFADDMARHKSLNPDENLNPDESGCPTSGFSDVGTSLLHPAATKDDRNNHCLLSLLAAHPRTPHTARFVCALALARDGQILHRAEGTVEGEILPKPRGTEGFGYDPLFLIPSLGLTLAELPREQKWRLSHRGNAFRSLLENLPSSF